MKLRAASPPAPRPNTGEAALRIHLKPYLAKLLAAMGLDVVYTRGEGDQLFYTDDAGREHAVLDMVGGYGAALFGHNHPELIRRAQQVLAERRPFVAQASTRPYAGLLAERLAQLASQSTGHAYLVTLANSGAEAIEAAIKHAELERMERVRAFFYHQRRSFASIRLGLRAGRLQVLDTLCAEAAQRLNVPAIADLDALEYHLTRHNHEALAGGTYHLAIRGAFHGMTSGALKLTHSPDFREPWHALGVRVQFVPRNDVDDLWREVADAETTCYELTIQDHGVALEERAWSRLVACFAEPIQGEGGILELSTSFLQSLRTAADQQGFPLIVDEIQAGMGRTGTFMASERSGVAGDYYLFSKALGGGLAKLSALLVRADRYVEEFGYLHTSTFADDDFSAAIGLAALELLTRDDGAVLQACRDKGDYLLARLQELRRRFPQVITDVRGRGLMVGVELTPQTEAASNLLRVASEQNLLAFLVSGYLLREECIRVAPTLSANNTIRLLPSAYVSFADLDRFCEGLERAVDIVVRSDVHRLVRRIAARQGEMPANGHDQPCVALHRAPRIPASGPVTRRVACIGHFIEPEDLLHWDPLLAPLSVEECSQLLEKTDAILEPFVADERVVLGSRGERVSLVMIGLPWTADQTMRRIRGGDLCAVQQRIEAGVELAKRRGCSLVGFAGYTSIATNNCQSLIDSEVGLTTGNSLTAVAAIEATHHAIADLGIDLASVELGVVGAVGNIGRVLAEIEAEHVRSLLLVGRPGAERRLQRLADAISGQVRQQRLGPQTPVQVATDLDALRSCDVIISATNSPQPLLHPTHLGDHPTVICDISVPGDVHRDLESVRADVRILKGGIIRLPLNQDLTIRGMVLPQGQAYACVAEVILLGLAGVSGHFSYGPLSPSRMREIGTLARQFGFTIEVR